MPHVRLSGLRGRNGVARDAPAKVEERGGLEGLLQWDEHMDDAKSKLRLHNPAVVHDNHVVARDAPEPTPAPHFDLKARQTASLTGGITSVDTSAADQESLMVAGPSPTPRVESSSSTARSTPTASPSPTQESSGGGGGDDNIGMKAGIALGVLGGLFIIFMIIYCILRSKRKNREKQRQDEKLADEMADRRASTKTSATAPRLSLRPVTQFLPKFGEDGKQQQYPDRRTSKEATIQLSTPGGTSKALPQAPSSESSVGASGSRNPFRDSAERPVTPKNNASRQDDYEAVPVSPVSESSEVASMISRDLPSPPGSPGPPGLGTSSLVRSTSVRKDNPKALDLTLPPPKRLPDVPPSPTGTEYSFHSMAPGAMPGPSKSAAAIAEAGGPASSTVHRVQLDFKPTLDDELGLKAGQLVRLLHEYDDGWALCIRLDRSQQGVVPRTCLSTRPVKPRPNPAGMRGPPVNPGSRPGTSGRPQSPKPPGSAKSAPGTAY